MRDDTIIVCGPYEVPNEWVEGYQDTDEDEDYGWVEPHWVDMSGMRRLTFETRACPCRRLHGYTIIMNWELLTGWPELITTALDHGFAALKQELAECPGAAA